MAVNVERILALADLIEKQPHTSFNADSGFTMEKWTHHCGTPACIAGWAEFEAKRTTGANVDADEYLGLSIDQAEDLFFMWDSEISLTETTPSQAATTLRHLAETGEVIWRAE
jgi:hypothetical protein